MTRVLLVDDQVSFRRQLRQLLRYAGLDVVGEVDDVATAEGLLQSLRPDLILLDLMLPDCNGLEGTRRLKMLRPEVRVVLLSAYPDHAAIYRAAAQEAGAEDFLVKDDLTLDSVQNWLK